MSDYEGPGGPPNRPAGESLGSDTLIDLEGAREKIQICHEWMLLAEEAFFRNKSPLEQALAAVRSTGPDGEDLADSVRKAVKSGYRDMSHLFRERAGIDDGIWNVAVKRLAGRP